MNEFPPQSSQSPQSDAERWDQNLEKRRQEMAAFTEEIQALHDEEVSGKAKTAHFAIPYFDADELTWQDQQAWKALKEKKLTEEQLKEYRTSVVAWEHDQEDREEVRARAEEARPKGWALTTRGMFGAFLGNRFSADRAQAQIEEILRQRAERDAQQKQNPDEQSE